MTRSHRQQHRRIWLGLSLVLSAVFLAAMAARQPVPVMPGMTQTSGGSTSKPPKL